jgi:hypothetical protein
MQGVFWRTVKIAAVAVPLAVIACSDDTTTGPQFGDLEFTPAFIDLELLRETSSVLSNEGSVSLGPILIGASLGVGIGQISGRVCPDMETFVNPGSVGSLIPGGSTEVGIVVDMSAVDPADCPDGSYDIDITASVGGLGLAATTVRIDFVGQN